ncbi:MAG TPA: hypothetical protein VIF15_21105 [Polyangiaceae bacterium]|jgi:hypothetical protein
MGSRTGALVGVFVAATAAACAAQGTGSNSGPPGGDDASIPQVDGSGPSPDAIVFGDDAGDDGTTSTGDDAGDDSGIGKTCQGLPDGTPCGAAPDICHDAPACAAGACATAAAKADGFVCAKAPDACHTDGTCKAGSCGAAAARADGFNWTAGDDTARCCGGKPLHTNTDSDCGACGIQCNGGNGESCQALGGHWFCRGCVASAACWSKCCSNSFSPPSCAASDCAGNCSATYCPPGTHCASGGGVSSDYCSY